MKQFALLSFHISSSPASNSTLTLSKIDYPAVVCVCWLLLKYIYIYTYHTCYLHMFGLVHNMQDHRIRFSHTCYVFMKASLKSNACEIVELLGLVQFAIEVCSVSVMALKIMHVFGGEGH